MTCVQRLAGKADCPTTAGGNPTRPRGLRGPDVNGGALINERLNYVYHINSMKVTGAISIVAMSLYVWDQNNSGGYYASHLDQMIRAIGTSFGFH